MKRSRAEAPPSADAARLGEELRDARVSSGLTVEDMSATLRIRRVYLNALEEGRVRDLPSPAYAVGFVRNYATALGLDAEEVVRRFRESMGTVAPRKQDLVFPEPVPERGVPAGVVVLLGAVIAVGAYVGWYQWSGSGQRSVDAVPAVPPRLENAARNGTSPNPPPIAVPGLTGGAGTSTVPLPEPVPVPVVVPAPPPPPPPPPSPTDASRITFRFTQPTWVMVRPANQQQPALFERTFRPGESYTPPNQWNLLISFGQVAGVEVLVDGQAQPGLAPGQGPRRNVPLDPTLFRAGVVPPGARFTQQPAAAAAPAQGGAAPAAGTPPGAPPGTPPGAPRAATPAAAPAAPPGPGTPQPAARPATPPQTPPPAGQPRP